MSRTIRNVLNFQFILFLSSGTVLIPVAGKVGSGPLFLMPAALIVLYSLMVLWGVGDCKASLLVKKRFDSIYLLGALYSLVSLIAMVAELSALSSSMPEPYLAAIALFYLAISISTSVAAMASRACCWVRFSRAKRNRTYLRYSILAAGE